MIRVFFEYLFPLLLPAAIYVAWVWYARATHQGEGAPPAIKKGPLFWCLLAGFLLMAAGLVTLALTSGAPPGSVYESPRLKDGKVVPPEYITK